MKGLFSKEELLLLRGLTREQIAFLRRVKRLFGGRIVSVTFCSEQPYVEGE